MNSNGSSAMEPELPAGFRFDPTEPELFRYYLIPKVRGRPLPCGLIMDLDAFRFDPEQLPLNHSRYALQNEAYFFTERSTSHPGNSARSTPRGYWRIYREDVPIRDGNGVMIGFKNKYVFCIGREPNGQETNWKMNEYRCSPSAIPTNTNIHRTWVVCKIRQKINAEEDDRD